MIRKPLLAEHCYPKEKDSLQSEIQDYIEFFELKEEVIGIVVPHERYPYSGFILGAVYSRIKIPDTFVFLGPNHLCEGEYYAIMVEGSWETPLGEVPIDSELARSLLKNSNYLENDFRAHQRDDNGIEIQLPILQYFDEHFKMVPISLYPPNGDYKDLGVEIATGIKASGKRVTIVASSNMNHYEEAQGMIEMRDKEAIDSILQLDEDKLSERVDSSKLTVCGYKPIVVMLVAARELGAKHARLIKYMTTGDIDGNYDSVVGLAGILVY